jgi:hypothetical protein
MGREAELDEDITADQTSIRIRNPEMFPQRGGKIRIRDEYISYASVFGTALTGCRRGQDGSTASGHGKGSFAGSTPGREEEVKVKHLSIV